MAIRVLLNALVRGSVALAFTAATPAAWAERIELTRADDKRTSAYWQPAPAPDRRPVIVALHGCGGLFSARGTTFDARYIEYTRLFHAAGWHVLLPDSFAGRSICAETTRARTVTVEDRRADVLAALDWLRARDDVDAARIVILGWSHGAMTALNVANAARSVYAQPLAGVALFYPGCRELLEFPFKVAAPVLMQLGEKDDWTPAKPCQALAQAARERNPAVPFDLIVYPDAYHAFDSARPVRFRPDVANGRGAHAGGNPAARSAAQARLMAFLHKVLQ